MEDKAFILSGLLKNRKDNTPLANEHLLLSFIDSISPKIMYSHTDSAGRFLFYINKMYDNKELFFQIVSKPKSSDFNLGIRY